MFHRLPLLPALLAGLFTISAFAQEKSHLALKSEWGSYIEKDFPFFSQTLDARKLGKEWPKDNLTPRGIILKLGNGYFACFDTDLLRIALIWKENKDGEYLTMDAMAPGSYRLPNRKASAGQGELPRPIGDIILANGRYHGWSVGAKADFTDTRTAAPDEGETSLGPMDTEIAQWKGIQMIRKDIPSEEREGLDYVLVPLISYRVGESKITEKLVRSVYGGLFRYFSITPHTQILHCAVKAGENNDIPDYFSVPPAKEMEHWKVNMKSGQANKITEEEFSSAFRDSLNPNWRETITTSAKTPASENNGLKREEVELPLKNPWKRNVRLSAFDFFSDGRAAFSTFDGDVWIVENLYGDLQNVKWKRFAAGLHDPIGLEISDDQIYVFDRNGIIRLHDTDGNGEADFYENFCNLVSQTAETREFANDIVEKPGGGFYIAKGGQVSTTRGKHNGTVVEISPDGKSFEVIATGLRMPYIGVDPKTGLLTASDQQGHWKPATPIHIIREGGYYGFQPAIYKEKAVHPATIDQPELHIPHFANQSGASQIWTRDPAKLGPLNDSLLHVGYNRPELFKIYLDQSTGKPQGAAASIMHGFPSGIMKARIHPIDGSLWLSGFKIWGTAADQISGLYRVTYNGGETWIPDDVRSSEKGIFLKFNQPVDETVATNLASYTVDRWNYKQTHNYGSGNYQLDGKPGQETMPVASAMVSEDKKSIFIGLPDMQPVESIRLTYRVPIPNAETPKIASAYLTVHELKKIDLISAGFSTNEVDLTLKAGSGNETKFPDPSIAMGKEAATTYGCIVCHSVDGKKPVGAAAGDATIAVGPTWKGLWNSKKIFTDGVELKKVDEAYLRESIVNPARKVPKGFETEKTGVGMPSYLGVLKDHEIDSIILYIKSLKK